MSELANSQNPWLGLASYSENEREFFFGREDEIAELLRLIQDETLVVLYGISGLGKTSLLRAGVVPVLRQQDFLPVVIGRTHYNSAETGLRETSTSKPERLFTGRTAEAAGDSTSVSWPVLTALRMAAGNVSPRAKASDSLWEYFHRIETQFWSTRQRLLTPVLIFDQFEELFTTGSRDEYHRIHTKLFLKDLSDLVYNRPPAEFQEHIETNRLKSEDYNFDPVPLRVVISLREDFLPQLSDLREQGFPKLLRAALRLRPLSEGAAGRCIACPAPELLESGVASRLVNFLAGAETGSRSPGPDESGTTLAPTTTRSIIKNGTSIEPALLSVVCRELNTERRRRGLPKISDGLLTLSQEQILADFYNRSFEGIAPELRRFVESELLSPGGYRDSRDLGDALSRPGITQAGIDQLIERRVLRYEDSRGLRRIELTHDVLTGIARRSRDERKKEEADVLRREAEERESETRRRLFGTRFALAVTAVLFAVTVFALLHAFSEQQRADANAKRADAETVDALAAKADTADANRRLEATNQRLNGTNQDIKYLHEAGEAYEAWDRGQFAKAHRLLEQDTPSDLRSWEWFFMEGLCSLRETGASRVLTGHTGAINALLTVPGQIQPMLISAGDDTTIRVWDLTSGREIGNLVSHKELVGLGFRFEQRKSDNAIVVNRVFAGGPAAKNGHLERNDCITAIAEGDSSLAQVSELTFDQITQRLEIDSEGKRVRIEVEHPDSSIREIIELVSERFTTQVKHDREIVRMALSPDGAFAASVDAEGQLCFWDVATGDLGGAIYTGSSIADLAFSPNGRWLAVLMEGSEDGRRLVFANAGKFRLPEHQFPTQDKTIKAFAFAPNSQVAFATEDGIIHLFDADQMHELKQIQTDLDVRQLIFSPKGDVLAASSGYKIVIFDVNNLSSPRQTFDAPEHLQLAFHPTGNYLATAGSDGIVRVWNLKTASEVRTLMGHSGPVTSLVFLPDNATLASGGQDNTIHLWNLRKFLPRNYRTYSIDDGVNHDIFGLCISPDSRYIASMKPWGSTIAIMDATNGTLLRTLKGNVFRTSFLPSESPWAVPGKSVLVVADKTIRFVDITTGKQIPDTPEFAKHTAPVRAVAMSHHGDSMVSGDEDGNVYLWNYDSKDPVPLQEGGGMATSVAISPDATWAAASFLKQHKVRVWNLRTKQPRDLPFASACYFLSFSPTDSDLLLVDESNGRLHVVSLETGKDKQVFWGHSGIVYDAIFYRDGRRVISAGADKTVRLWDVETGIELFRLDDAATYSALAFSPDGLRLAGAHVDQIRMWNAALFSASQVENDWVSCYSRGNYHDGLENWVQARDDYARALRLHGNEPDLLMRLANVQGELDNFSEAEQNYRRVPSDSSENVGALSGVATALLAQSKQSECRQICQRLQQLAVAHYDPHTANAAAWWCTMIPDAGTDLAPLLGMLHRVTRDFPKNYVYQDTLGGVLYRTGHYEEAISVLRTAMTTKRRPSTPSVLADALDQSWDGTAFDWVFLAMANYRLSDADHKEEAKRWLAKAGREVELLAKDPFFDDPNYSWGWKDKVQLETLYKEASTLITK